MTDGLNHCLVAEKSIPGATFSIIDYHWDAGADIIDFQPEVILRWRIRPYRVKVQGLIGAGKRSSFGQLMLHPANIPTYAEAGEEGEDARTLVCKFDRQWLERIAGKEVNWERGTLEPCFDLRNGDIDHAMRRLMRELLEPGFASDALSEALAASMGVDIVRIFGADAEGGEARGTLSGGRLRQIRDYVESIDEGCPTLSDVAQQCGVSVAHLRRLYKATTGQTLHDYIEEVRVNRAKTLLLDSTLPLKVISYKLGFCHPSAFSFAFKKLTGEAPRDFRHRCASGLSVAA